MATDKTVTSDKLIAEYAEPLAKAIGITLDEQDRTPEGFPAFLEAVAGRLSPTDHVGEWLHEAAEVLNAIARLGDDGPKAQESLREVDQLLYEARAELELV